jgi:hypothetical protein
MKHPFALLPLLLALSLAPTQVVSAQQAATQSAATASSLDLLGANGEHVSISAAELQSLPRQTVTVHNPHTKADETYQGVELSLLLERIGAPLGAKLRGKALAIYVVAEGTDRYRAIYSLAEVDPAFHSGTVIVADRENGQPIAKDGPFKMVNTEDKRPARWVRNLASIRLVATPTR